MGYVTHPSQQAPLLLQAGHGGLLLQPCQPGQVASLALSGLHPAHQGNDPGEHRGVVELVGQGHEQGSGGQLPDELHAQGRGGRAGQGQPRPAGAVPQDEEVDHDHRVAVRPAVLPHHGGRDPGRQEEGRCQRHAGRRHPYPPAPRAARRGTGHAQAGHGESSGGAAPGQQAPSPRPRPPVGRVRPGAQGHGRREEAGHPAAPGQGEPVVGQAPTGLRGGGQVPGPGRGPPQEDPCAPAGGGVHLDPPPGQGVHALTHRQPQPQVHLGGVGGVKADAVVTHHHADAVTDLAHGEQRADPASGVPAPGVALHIAQGLQDRLTQGGQDLRGQGPGPWTRSGLPHRALPRPGHVPCPSRPPGGAGVDLPGAGGGGVGPAPGGQEARELVQVPWRAGVGRGVQGVQGVVRLLVDLVGVQAAGGQDRQEGGQDVVVGEAPGPLLALQAAGGHQGAGLAGVARGVLLVHALGARQEAGDRVGAGPGQDDVVAGGQQHLGQALPSHHGAHDHLEDAHGADPGGQAPRVAPHDHRQVGGGQERQDRCGAQRGAGTGVYREGDDEAEAAGQVGQDVEPGGGARPPGEGLDTAGQATWTVPGGTDPHQQDHQGHQGREEDRHHGRQGGPGLGAERLRVADQGEDRVDHPHGADRRRQHHGGGCRELPRETSRHGCCWSMGRMVGISPASWARRRRSTLLAAGSPTSMNRWRMALMRLLTVFTLRPTRRAT